MKNVWIVERSDDSWINRHRVTVAFRLIRAYWRVRGLQALLLIETDDLRGMVTQMGKRRMTKLRVQEKNAEAIQIEA